MTQNDVFRQALKMFNEQNNSLILQTPVSLHFEVALNEELMQNKESERTQTPRIVVTQNSENVIARSMQTKVISSASNIGCLDEEIDTETPANVRPSPKREKSKGEEERKLKMQGEERKLASVHTYTLNRNITELKKSKNQQALRTKLDVTSSQFRETKNCKETIKLMLYQTLRECFRQQFLTKQVPIYCPCHSAQNPLVRCLALQMRSISKTILVLQENMKNRSQKALRSWIRE